jgi:hypothetical protein
MGFRQKGGMDRICDENQCPEAKATWDPGTWVFQRAWSATLSINKVKRLGWNDHIDLYQSLVHAFEKFVELKQIPQVEAKQI